MINLHLNIWKALLCSFAFLLQYTALYSAQNVQSVLFSDDDYGQLGFYSNAVVYFGQGTGSIFCVYFTAKYGDSKSMAWSGLFALPFILSLLLPAYKSLPDNINSNNFWLSSSFVYPMILFTSLLNGLGEGVAQPASGTYISDCAVESNKGFYYALFWAFYMGSQVFGNLIAAFVLYSLDQRYYVLIMTGLSMIACVLFFFLKAPIVQHETLRKDITD
jgi:predicted MFS family arabinose efflux permease